MRCVAAACSEFSARNPALKRLDDHIIARGRGTRAVSSQFVTKQLEYIEGGNISESAAYDLARRWMIENGPAVLRRADPELAKRGRVPASALPPIELFETVMAKQSMLLKEALRSVSDKSR
ncbi:hypothetical protein EON66_01665 [archaeon]|nr:MAG: hypothetical protein EON66_01665 [archaeon]